MDKEEVIKILKENKLTNVGKMTPYNSEENDEMGKLMNKVYTVSGYISVIVAISIVVYVIINGV